MKIKLFALVGIMTGLGLTGCQTTQDVISKVHTPATPIEQVLKQRSDLLNELATVEVRQYFNRVENPTSAEVKVTETGLMDDSVNTIRTVYNFKLEGRTWIQVAKKEEYKCARGKNTKTFQTAKCS